MDRSGCCSCAWVIMACRSATGRSAALFLAPGSLRLTAHRSVLTLQCAAPGSSRLPALIGTQLLLVPDTLCATATAGCPLSHTPDTPAPVASARSQFGARLPI